MERPFATVAALCGVAGFVLTVFLELERRQDRSLRWFTDTQLVACVPDGPVPMTLDIAGVEVRPGDCVVRYDVVLWNDGNVAIGRPAVKNWPSIDTRRASYVPSVEDNVNAETYEVMTDGAVRTIVWEQLLPNQYVQFTYHGLSGDRPRLGGVIADSDGRPVAVPEHRGGFIQHDRKLWLVLGLVVLIVGWPACMSWLQGRQTRSGTMARATGGPFLVTVVGLTEFVLAGLLYSSLATREVPAFVEDMPGHPYRVLESLSGFRVPT